MPINLSFELLLIILGSVLLILGTPYFIEFNPFGRKKIELFRPFINWEYISIIAGLCFLILGISIIIVNGFLENRIVPLELILGDLFLLIPLFATIYFFKRRKK